MLEYSQLDSIILLEVITISFQVLSLKKKKKKEKEKKYMLTLIWLSYDQLPATVKVAATFVPYLQEIV